MFISNAKNDSAALLVQNIEQTDRLLGQLGKLLSQK
jgi:hypothetical protein